MAVLSLGEIAQADQAEYMRFDLRLGDLLSSGGVAAGAAVLAVSLITNYQYSPKRNLAHSTAVTA